MILNDKNQIFKNDKTGLYPGNIFFLKDTILTEFLAVIFDAGYFSCLYVYI